MIQGHLAVPSAFYMALRTPGKLPYSPKDSLWKGHELVIKSQVFRYKGAVTVTVMAKLALELPPVLHSTHQQVVFFFNGKFYFKKIN